MSGAARPSPTAAAATALAAAVARARTAMARADTAATRSAARIADDRFAALTVLRDTETRLSAGTRAAAAMLQAVERRRRRTAARLEWRIRAVHCRLAAARAVLLWHRASRLLAVALIATVCLWWGIRVWSGIAAFLTHLMAGR